MPQTSDRTAYSNSSCAADGSGRVAGIEAFAREAGQSGIDLLLVPECFLQGYLVEAGHLRRHAVTLDSAPFQAVLARLRPIRPTLVVGLIEPLGEQYSTTAVVVQSGQVRGPTSVMDPTAEVVAQVPLLTVGMVLWRIV